jgi:hypothetical protein
MNRERSANRIFSLIAVAGQAGGHERFKADLAVVGGKDSRGLSHHPGIRLKQNRVQHLLFRRYALLRG